MDPGPDPVTPPPQQPLTLPNKLGGWGGAILSTYAMTLLLAAMIVAYFMKADQIFNVLAGVAATNATTVINFKFGSSASSQSKDEIISKQLPKA